MISNDFLGDPGGLEPLKVEPQDMEDYEEIEPLPRDRSNTWPLQRPSNDTQTSPLIHTEIPELNESGENGSYESLDHLASLEGGAEGAAGQKKTNTSRRNAWGNFSYADLITQAVMSSPEKRLTLSQIYDWMVQNVPYFRDKGDSNSSAGWKNSIRHNLSLHNRFMRVQNEGAGKSSWWVINPEAKPGKSSRRRAGSMEAKTLEKKRGRAKKKVDQLRMEGGHLTPAFSESSDLSSTFSLSPNDFRHRSDSNVSSYSTGGLVNGGLHSPLGVEDEFEPHKMLGQNMPGAHELFPDIADALTQSMNINESSGLTLASPYSQQQSSTQQPSSVQPAPMTPQHQQQKPPPSYVVAGRLVYLANGGSPVGNGSSLSSHQSPNKMVMRGPGGPPQMLSVECNSPSRPGYVVSQISPQPGTQICSQSQQNVTPPYGLKQEPSGGNPPAYQELYPVHLPQHGLPNGTVGGGGLSNNPILRDALIHKCSGAALATNALLQQQHGVNMHNPQNLQGGQYYPSQPNGTNLPSELCEISYDSVQSHFSTIDIAPYLESLSGGIGSDFDSFDNIGQL